MPDIKKKKKKEVEWKKKDTFPLLKHEIWSEITGNKVSWLEFLRDLRHMN